MQSERNKSQTVGQETEDWLDKECLSWNGSGIIGVRRGRKAVELFLLDSEELSKENGTGMWAASSNKFCKYL